MITLNLGMPATPPYLAFHTAQAAVKLYLGSDTPSNQIAQMPKSGVEGKTPQ
jgi:hypothetical protein